jgi:uncharacterized protein YpmB
MSFLIYFLIFIILIWLSFLTYIIYTKSSSKNKNNEVISDSKVKINITRFNPFDDIGGDQSFIFSILDQNNSGAILTSLHNRDLTRIYAKPIKNGEGNNITLSKEEKLAIVKTIKG